VRIRLARSEDRPFLVALARLACALEDRPVPDADDPAVVALLPSEDDGAVVATEGEDRPVGAAWLHLHEPPLLRDEDAQPLPELGMAVVVEALGRGVGTALVEALAAQAPRRFSALTLNVHLLNPAARLYARTGFRVAGAGRGWFGVAMSRPLRRGD